jgi:MFS family permease
VLSSYRNLAAIVAGLTLVQTSVSALSAFGPLTLTARGHGAVTIGMVAAAYGAGFFLGALRAPVAIRAIGHIRAFAGFAAGATILALGLHDLSAVEFWILLQAGLGLCVSALFTTGESWIADVAPRERRGALLAFYLVVSKGGHIIGPVLLSGIVAGYSTGFSTIAAIFAASLIPVCATQRLQPAPPSAQPFGARELWTVAPAAVLSALAAGLVNGAVMQLYALYATQAASTSTTSAGVGTAAAFNAALAAGGVLAQWPAGAYSDRHDRRLVISALAAIGAVTALLLAFATPHLPWSALLVLAAVWGAGSMSFYGIAVAHAADRAQAGQATGMMAGILLIWAVGAFIGPPLAGLVMASPLGTNGLFLYAAVVLGALCIAMLLRRVERAAPALDAKSQFAVAPATSTAAATIDPRM